MLRRLAPPVALVAVFAAATSLGPTSDTSVSDFGLYRVYARAVLEGQVPYRDFALEYPPGALVPMVLAGLPDGTRGWVFRFAFGALMCASALVVQREAARLAPGRERAAAWALVLLPVAAGAIVRERFDLFAVALAVAGLRLALDGARAGRASAGGFALLGLGVATKLFPLVLAASCAAWLWGAGARREAVRGAAVAAGVALAVCLPFAALAPGGFAEQARFHAERPLQIESLPATVLRVTADPRLTGTPRNPDRFRSQGVEGDGAGAAAAIAGVLQLGGILLGVALALRAGRRGDGRGLLLASAVALLAFLALGKVLSPQYLLWIAPLAPALYVAGARTAAALIVAALALTQLGFPSRYFELVRGEPLALTLVAARDALLVAALALLASAAARTRRRPGRTGAPARGSGT